MSRLLSVDRIVIRSRKRCRRAVYFSTTPTPWMLKGLDCWILRFYNIIHLGDSRIYSYENETLRQMTDDDVSEEGKLTSYLGRGQKLIPHYDEGSAYGKQFLLCSDGLYKKLDDNMISAAFRCLAPNNLRQEALNLSRLAIERGERDNISVALII